MAHHEFSLRSKYPNGVSPTHFRTYPDNRAALQQLSAKLAEIVMRYDQHATLSLDPAQMKPHALADHLTASLRISSNSLSGDLVVMIATNIATLCDFHVADYRNSPA